jgi:uncharacterized BrkB/YihY/UPF0761 family membrane protein
MVRRKLIRRLILSALVYVVATFLYRYIGHRRAPEWGAVPGILLTWLFFAIGYFGWDWFLAHRRERNRVV